MSGKINPEFAQNVLAGRITPQEAVKQAEEELNGRVYKQKDLSARLAQYKSSRVVREKILSNKTPFITPHFLPDFYLTQGLVLVGGKPGRAKTTTGANIIAGFLNHCPGKQAIVISNEEAPDALYERIACILLGLSYQDRFKGKLNNSELNALETCVQQVAEYVEIVSEDETWDPSYIEDTQAILQTAAKRGVGLVLVDYLQTITGSRDHPEQESYQVSKKLGFYFKDYGKKYGVPVVVLAQLNESDSLDMSSRVQNDKTIFNHAFIAIEVKPDFDTCTTVFTITKDRFSGCTGKKVTMDFKGGAYVCQGV